MRRHLALRKRPHLTPQLLLLVRQPKLHVHPPELLYKLRFYIYQISA